LSSFFFLQGKAPNEIHAILTETLGENSPPYATVKTGWPTLNVVTFPSPGRPKTVTTPEIIDQIHQLILKDRRISDKSIAEQLVISRERVGSIIREDSDMRKLSAKWVPKCLNVNCASQSSEQLMEIFRSDPNGFLSRLVTMHETWLYH
jgi:hypothetical protein